MTEIAPAPETPAPPVPAPPAHPWVEQETAVAALLQTLDEETRVQCGQWVDALQAEAMDLLKNALERAAQLHQGLVERAAFDRESPPPVELWRSVIIYRQGVKKRVLAPLEAHLAQHKMSEEIATRCLKVLAAVAPLADDAPPRQTLLCPPTLYARIPEDRFLRRLRKWFVRRQYGAQRLGQGLRNAVRRLFRRLPTPLAPRSRPLATRDLCSYHVRVRLGEALVPLHKVLQQHAASVSAHLERTLSKWTNDMLVAEHILDDVSFRQPGMLKTLPPPSTAHTEALPQTDPAVFIDLTEALQQALNDLVEATTLPPLEIEKTLHTAATALAQDVARAGTFLLDMRKRQLPPTDRLPAMRIQADEQVWTGWHEQVRDRLRLNSCLLDLRGDLVRLEGALLKRTAEATLRPVIETFQPLADHLRTTEQQVATLCDEASADAPEALAKSLRMMQVQTQRTLRLALNDLPGLVPADQALSSPGQPEWEQMLHLFKQLPEHLTIHALVEAKTLPNPTDRAFHVNMHAFVEEMIAPLPESLKAAAGPLRKQVLQVWSETEQVQHIVQYNLDVALDEVMGTTETAQAEGEPAEPEESEESEEQTRHGIPAARELATQGLQRAADMLEQLGASLYEPWEAFADAVFSEFQSNWADVHRRMRSEDRVEEQWFDFRVRAERQFVRLQRQAKDRMTHYRQVGRQRFQRVLRRLERLIRLGRSAVGVRDPIQEERLRLQTLDAVTNLSALQSQLPLIYRKLFSFEAIKEPSLLEGRQTEINRILHHFERWRNKTSAGTLILELPRGSGRTSLLNVLRLALAEEAVVYSRTLEERPRDERALAACLAETLGSDLDGEPSLDRLEAHILGTPRPEPPPVCLLDNLEHLFIRAPGGFELVERAMIFFSRTDEHVFWLATTGHHAWHYIAKTVGVATGMITVYLPASLDRAALEAIIINRHRRSGMTLQFTEPKDPSPLLRQRLRRARTPEALQAVLREAYFDRLHRLSGQNIMLALFYWLRSADFKAEEGALTVRPLEPLSFNFLTAFDLNQAFTLKAFILHNTLTLEEHNRIFPMSAEQGMFILESLLNMRLIEPCSPEVQQEVGAPGGIIVGARYRLRPLVLHPVTEFLRDEHILY